MGAFLQLVGYAFAGGVASLIGAIVLVLTKDKFLEFLNELTAFAAGVLLSVALIDLLPEAAAGNAKDSLGWLILGGILFLFLMEKSNLWFHHHHAPHLDHLPNMLGVWLGDLFHNYIDGVAIGASFLINHNLGMMTAMAVALHEIPKEMADFSLYMKAGYSRGRMIVLNIAANIGAVIGAIMVYLWGEQMGGIQYYLLPITAGMFLYIALADLVPGLHEETKKRQIVGTVCFFVGLAAGVWSASLH